MALCWIPKKPWQWITCFPAGRLERLAHSQVAPVCSAVGGGTGCLGGLVDRTESLVRICQMQLLGCPGEEACFKINRQLPSVKVIYDPWFSFCFRIWVIDYWPSVSSVDHVNRIECGKQNSTGTPWPSTPVFDYQVINRTNCAIQPTPWEKHTSQ